MSQQKAAHSLYRAPEEPKPTAAENKACERELRLVRLPEVQRRTGYGKTSIYESVRRGTFPKPVALTATARAWRSDEIEQWIAARTAARDAQGGAQ